MKKRDLQILSYLRRNARESLTDLSKMSRIPVSTIYDRLKTKMDNCVVKHTSIIDFGKLGYTTRAHILLKVHKDKRDELREHLNNHHMINTVSKINNGYDFIAEGVFRHMKELEDFLESIEARFELVSHNVFYIIEDIKKESFMECPSILPILFQGTNWLD